MHFPWKVGSYVALAGMENSRQLTRFPVFGLTIDEEAGHGPARRTLSRRQDVCRGSRRSRRVCLTRSRGFLLTQGNVCLLCQSSQLCQLGLDKDGQVNT